MKTIKRFFNHNRKLSFITLASIVIVLSYYLSYDYIEIIPGINKWYELLMTLSIGVIVNCIFYVFQVYLPKLEDEIRAQKALDEKLYGLYCRLTESVELSGLFFKGIQENKIFPITNKVDYKLITGEDEKGLARRLSIELYISTVKSTLENLKSFTEKDLFSRCSTEYIDLLIDIRENRYLKILVDAYIMGFPPNTTYGNLDGYHDELMLLLQTMNNMFLSRKEISIVLLSDEEKVYVERHQRNGDPRTYINLGYEGSK